MTWIMIKETKRTYADSSYYLKAERECPEGKLVLEVSWIERFMYNISVDFYRKNSGRKLLFKRVTKPQLLYNCSVFCEDRIEKYGHQIMRITEESPILKLERLNSLQKDGVLNYNLSEKCNVDFVTTLPAKDNE